MGKMIVKNMILGELGTNCYIVYDEDTKDAAVIDPADRGDLIAAYIEENSLKLSAIYLTHGHFDHMSGADELRSLTGVKLYCPEGDLAVIEDPELNVSMLFTGRAVSCKADEPLTEGSVIKIGIHEGKVLFTPGHTPGGVCFYFEEDGILFSGDTVFEGSVGRTDLPGCSGSSLMKSIKTKILPLPDDVEIYPGHGGMTTIGDEKKYNPYFGL